MAPIAMEDIDHTIHAGFHADEIWEPAPRTLPTDYVRHPTEVSKHLSASTTPRPNQARFATQIDQHASEPPSVAEDPRGDCRLVCRRLAEIGRSLPSRDRQKGVRRGSTVHLRVRDSGGHSACSSLGKLADEGPGHATPAASDARTLTASPEHPSPVHHHHQTFPPAKPGARRGSFSPSNLFPSTTEWVIGCFGKSSCPLLLLPSPNKSLMDCTCSLPPAFFSSADRHGFLEREGDWPPASVAAGWKTVCQNGMSS
ncbi:hypothetical protein BP5796_07157 [Coleophoma crateriformis]|uniref:Uncharacterized protein n=1 Tax=Coleophoma crateriformis TaxID=565419 RepID=A0A3D8RI40_9HELO|nr:hypothetical protein BP5796_07157 [Coleophoma crateriformis]